jgi:hypothetical protein
MPGPRMSKYALWACFVPVRRKERPANGWTDVEHKDRQEVWRFCCGGRIHRTRRGTDQEITHLACDHHAVPEVTRRLYIRRRTRGQAGLGCCHRWSLTHRHLGESDRSTERERAGRSARSSHEIRMIPGAGHTGRQSSGARSSWRGVASRPRGGDAVVAAGPADCALLAAPRAHGRSWVGGRAATITKPASVR